MNIASALARLVGAAWSLLRRRSPARDATYMRMEWDNDVPPFPILTGEVARAEARVPAAIRQRHRRFGT